LLRLHTWIWVAQGNLQDFSIRHLNLEQNQLLALADLQDTSLKNTLADIVLPVFERTAR
jgi:hypothetical protein